uniref:Uncharacterized protein n=1 Tax=Meloidogyne enterolobii TaxID=390850 RepID=A0A6V7YBW3_MELEN|nr:unnamed protein product [Meloidogyne enterolobii]
MPGPGPGFFSQNRTRNRFFRIKPEKPPGKTGFSQKYPVPGHRARKKPVRARPGFEL